MFNKSVFLAGFLAASSLGMSAQAQDFSGFFAGLYGASAYSGSDRAVGLKFGYDHQMGNKVIGGDVDYFKASPSGDSEVFVNVRGGYVVTPKAMVFASVGRGTYYPLNLPIYSAGFGGEFKVTDSVSLRADYEWHNALGFPLSSAERFFKLGANWRF